MKINPSRPDQPRGPAADRLRGPEASPQPLKGGTAAPEPVPAPADRAEISDAARALQQDLPSLSGGAPSLEPGRMKELLQKIAQGFYDRPEVQDQVVSRLAADLDHEAPGS